MNYAKIKSVDIANGPGCRVSLFVSGCRNKCPGCFNPETHDFQYGLKYTDLVTDHIIDLLRPDYISGFSILGGEPLDPLNRDTVRDIIMSVRSAIPKKSIWVYTGYLYDDVIDACPWLVGADVLVDGRFEIDQARIGLPFRGSFNQRIIDIHASLRKGHVILLNSSDKIQ